MNNVPPHTPTSAITLSAPIPPSILVQPLSQNVMVGQAVTFVVSAAGTVPLSYQWQRNGVPIGGAILSSFTMPLVSGADNGAAFSVIVNASGTIAF